MNAKDIFESCPGCGWDAKTPPRRWLYHASKWDPADGWIDPVDGGCCNCGWSFPTGKELEASA